MAFELATNCPPSFEKMPDDSCELKSLYDLYKAPSGFGGLRVPLPELTDRYTAEQIDLGRYLFFDPILSKDKTLSCAHCHHPDFSFADGLPRSIGVGGQGVGSARTGAAVLDRAAPTLWNVGYLKQLFWDGRAQTLEEQAKGPLFAEAEMNNTREQLERDLNDNPTYRRLFQQAFSLEGGTEITTERVAQALSAFQASLVSLNSRYDRYAHGDETQLNEQEQHGHNLFRSFVTRCTQCHTPPLFTNGEFAVIGVPEPPGKAFDSGAEAVTGEASLRGAFKIPSLRNIMLTSPYMHSGVFTEISEVIDFYNDKRGHAVPENEDLLIHWHIHLQGPTLSEQEKAALIAFLHTITDESLKPQTPKTVPSGLPVVDRIIH